MYGLPQQRKVSSLTAHLGTKEAVKLGVAYPGKEDAVWLRIAYSGNEEDTRPNAIRLGAAETA